MNPRKPLLCAVIACQRPQGTPHVDDCPYFGQDGIPVGGVHTIDVGYVHVLTEHGGPCVGNCPHPEHEERP